MWQAILEGRKKISTSLQYDISNKCGRTYKKDTMYNEVIGAAKCRNNKEIKQKSELGDDPINDHLAVKNLSLLDIEIAKICEKKKNKKK